MLEITARQGEMLAVVHEYIRSHGYSPSIRDICKVMKISSLRGVTVTLDALERKGQITRGVKARSLLITEQGKTTLGLSNCLQEEMLAALEAAEAAARHWFDDGPDGCQECDRHALELCEVALELQEKADDMREAVLAKVRKVPAQKRAGS